MKCSWLYRLQISLAYICISHTTFHVLPFNTSLLQISVQPLLTFPHHPFYLEDHKLPYPFYKLSNPKHSHFLCFHLRRFSMDSQEPPPPPPLTLPQPPPPLLPSQNPPYFFTPSSVLPSSSLQPSLPLPSLDIDWISLLSGQAGGGFGDTMMINKEKLQSSCDRNEGGDDDKDEKSGKRRLGGRMSKASRPRFAFQTRSADDILDDGYRWRKYGQKAVKNSIHPRYI